LNRLVGVEEYESSRKTVNYKMCGASSAPIPDIDDVGSRVSHP